MASELEYLRKDRDRWIEAWRKAIGDAEQMRRCHEVDLAQRTAERDEARRIACSALAAKGVDLATNRGWDCFDAKEGKP
jgi:hypothetical protein